MRATACFGGVADVARVKRALLPCFVVIIALTFSSAAFATAAEEEQTPGWLKHVRLGARASYLSLDDHSRVPHDSNRDNDIDAREVLAVSYMGSITELNAEQWVLPTRIYAQWALSRFWGFELGWEDYKVSTATWWDGHSDGAFSLSGPTLSVYGRYRNSTRFSPYTQAGVACLDASFNADLRWTVIMDEAQFEQWLQAGAPETWRDGERQHLDVENEFGLFFMAGCEIALTRRFSMDLFVRYLSVDLSAHWYNTRLYFDAQNPDGDRKVSLDNGYYRFPMSNTSFGLGFLYGF